MSPDPLHRPASSFDDIFKAYDIRGTYPDELNARIVYAVGVGLGRFVLAQGAPDKRVVLARDIRKSGVELSRALSAGLLSVGLGVVDVGLASTDLLYFASGSSTSQGRCSRRRTTRPLTTESSSVSPGLVRSVVTPVSERSIAWQPKRSPPRRPMEVSRESRTTSVWNTSTCSRSSLPTCARSSTSRT